MKNGGLFHSYVGLPKGDGVENDGNIHHIGVSINGATPE
jgi:hypothetical protein